MVQITTDSIDEYDIKLQSEVVFPELRYMLSWKLGFISKTVHSIKKETFKKDNRIKK